MTNRARAYMAEVGRRGGRLRDRDERREVALLAGYSERGANGAMYGGRHPLMRTLEDGSSVPTGR